MHQLHDGKFDVVFSFGFGFLFVHTVDLSVGAVLEISAKVAEVISVHAFPLILGMRLLRWGRLHRGGVSPSVLIALRHSVKVFSPKFFILVSDFQVCRMRSLQRMMLLTSSVLMMRTESSISAIGVSSILFSAYWRRSASVQVLVLRPLRFGTRRLRSSTLMLSFLRVMWIVLSACWCPSTILRGWRRCD